MGDISEAMINGDLCEGCGVVMKGQGKGFPRRCKSCK